MIRRSLLTTVPQYRYSNSVATVKRRMMYLSNGYLFVKNCTISILNASSYTYTLLHNTPKCSSACIHYLNNTILNASRTTLLHNNPVSKRSNNTLYSVRATAVTADAAAVTAPTRLTLLLIPRGSPMKSEVAKTVPRPRPLEKTVHAPWTR